MKKDNREVLEEVRGSRSVNAHAGVNWVGEKAACFFEAVIGRMSKDKDSFK